MTKIESIENNFASKIRRRRPENVEIHGLNVGQEIISLTTQNTYKICEMVGEGAFGVVLACSDIWENDLVIKIPKAGSGVDSEQRATKELKALLLVRHPKIVPIHDAFFYKGQFCIVSGRCTAHLDWLKSIPNFYPAAWFRLLANNILQALQFTHAHGLVHCDVHEGNVFVHFERDKISVSESATSFMLGDYGLARPFHELEVSGTFLDCIKPPEAINPAEYGSLSQQVDVYQAGILFLRFLVPDLPRFSQPEILEGQPQEYALALGTPLGSAISKMLRRHTEYRTRDALTAWREIRASLDEQS